MTIQSVPSREGEPITDEAPPMERYDEATLSNLSPQEQDDLVLAEERVAGSGYLKLKRRKLRNRGKPIRRTMWEPTKKR